MSKADEGQKTRRRPRTAHRLPKLTAGTWACRTLTCSHRALSGVLGRLRHSAHPSHEGSAHVVITRPGAAPGAMQAHGRAQSGLEGICAAQEEQLAWCRCSSCGPG